tara:strand:- start:348 stop:506 length:159 start_codon:yes stop_codon:yes gene_type:complete
MKEIEKMTKKELMALVEERDFIKWQKIRWFHIPTKTLRLQVRRWYENLNKPK